MRNLLLALALCCCTTGAQAQIRANSFKLAIDTDVLSYSSVVEGSDDPESTVTNRMFSIGPGGSVLATGLPGYVGIVLGYVAHPHVIPQVHLSLAHASSKEEVVFGSESESQDGPNVTSIMLRPEIEIPINPDAQVVGYGLVGFDYRHSGTSDDSAGNIYENTLDAYGPVLGVGMHIFASEAVSFDLGAQFSYLVADMETTLDGETEGDDSAVTARVFSLTAGLSLWL